MEKFKPKISLKSKISSPIQQLAQAVQAAQQAAASNQQKQDEINRAVLMQRFQGVRPGPHMTMAIPVSMATPVSSNYAMFSPMRHLGPPTLIGGNLMRPPPMGLPPGKDLNIFPNILFKKNPPFQLFTGQLFFFIFIFFKYNYLIEIM